MKTQKFIKKAMVVTMLFSTMILPSIQTTTALADTFNQTSVNDVEIKNNVSKVTVNFIDLNGNKLGQITKDHILIGKNFKTVNKYMYDNWEILNAEQIGVLKEGGNTLDITLKSNKTYTVTIQYMTEDRQILQTESLEIPHGSKILINPKNAEGYELLSDSKELVVNSNTDTQTVKFMYKSTAENQKDFHVEKAEVIDEGFALSNINLENGDKYSEVDSFVDIVPDNYNYQYTDTFNAINNDPILRNITYSNKLDFNDLMNANTIKHLSFTAKSKDLMTFDDYFGKDVTGISSDKKVVDLNEVLKVHGLNPDELLQNASFANVSIVNGEQPIDDFSKIEDAKYLLGMLHAPISNVNNLGDYLDYEFNNVHEDIVVTYDVPLDLPKYFPDMLLAQYPRVASEISKNLEGKRVPLFDGGKFEGSFNQNLSAFGDIYKKDGQFRVKVYMIDRPLNSGDNYRLNYIGALKIDLNSQITVNYVNEKGEILDTKTEIVAKDTNYNILNKAFEGYGLKDSNDKDKVVFVNKDMVVNVEYKPLESTPQTETGKVIVNYLDENGNKIIDSKKFTDNVDNDFTVNAELLDGYDLLSDKVMTGKVTKEDTIINFNYKKVKETEEPEVPTEPQEPTTPEKPVEPQEPENPVESTEPTDTEKEPIKEETKKEDKKDNLYQTNYSSNNYLLAIITTALVSVIAFITFKKFKK